MPVAEALRSVARDRRRERRPVTMVGYIMPQSGVRHMVELFDLNYGGCGILTPVPLLPGDRVKLTVHERGSIPAEVRWCRDGRAGLDFSPSEERREPVARKGPRSAHGRSHSASPRQAELPHGSSRPFNHGMPDRIRRAPARGRRAVDQVPWTGRTRCDGLLGRAVHGRPRFCQSDSSSRFRTAARSF